MKKNLAIIILLMFFNPVFSKVTLPSFFTDNMVLQQNTSVKIWGSSDKHDVVTVQTGWDRKQYKVKIKADGKWEVLVATPKYGGPYNLSINDGDLISLKNILIGDVWLCSGQSNMEMPLAGWGKINNYQQEIKEANYPEIRLLQAAHVTSNQPLDDVKIKGDQGWQPCSPLSVAEFSAAAYFFARTIYQKTKIPIGLIHTSWGGTIAEAWISASSLLKADDFKTQVNEIKNSNEELLKSEYKKKLADWERVSFEKDAGFKNGAPQWVDDKVSDGGWSEMDLPNFFENSSIGNYDGAVWFRKTITIPDDMAGRSLILNLGAIDDNEITYFNGEKIGETIGHNIPRKYTIPAKLVKAGKNLIAIRVFDTGGDGGLYDKENPFNITDGTKQISLKGKWKLMPGLDLQDLPPFPNAGDGPNRATVLYNAMIHPFVPFKIKGAIWYQGESNASRAKQYRWLFPMLIKDWRQKWGIGNFPFYFVQLAAYMKKDEQPPQNSNWAMLREAQYKTLALPATGMATAVDIGNDIDIHPKNKQEVGRRLALIALHNYYHFPIEYSGPQLASRQIRQNKFILKFSHAEGLNFKGDQLSGFAICGADKKFYWADAIIENNTVVISCAAVQSPVAVRYAWGDDPDVNLYNSSGLPAVPFRTDDWD